MRDDESLGLRVAADADPLSVLLRRLAPVPVSKTTIPFVKQVTHQLGQKVLKGNKNRQL